MRGAAPLAALALAALAGPGLAPAPAAGAQEVVPAELGLVAQTPWAEVGGTFDLRLAVEGIDRPAQADLEITVFDDVAARFGFTRSLDGDLRAPLLTTVRPLGDLPPGRDGSRLVSLPVDELGLGGQGVYPVRVALRTSDAGVVDDLVTHLVRVPAPAAGDEPPPLPLAVALVQPFGAPPALEPDGTVTLDRARARDLDGLADALDGSPTPLTLVPTAESLDALATTGGEDTLARVRRSLAGRQLVEQSYVDVDVETLVEENLAGELARQLARGRDATFARLGRRPAADALSVDDALGDDAQRVLRFLGVERLVMDEDDLEALDLALTPTAPFGLEDGEGGRTAVATVDAGLRAHFPERGDEVLAAHHLLADLAVLFFDRPGNEVQRGVALRPPSGWRPSAPFLAVLLDALGESPVLTPVTVDGLFDQVDPFLDEEGEPVVRRAAPVDPPEGRVDARAIRRTRTQMVGVEAVVGSSNQVLDLVDRLLLVGQAVDLGAGGRRRYLEAAATTLAQPLEGVRVLDRGGFRLTAQEGSLPLTVVTGSPPRPPPTPLEVTLTLESAELDFLDGSPSSPGRYVDQLTLEGASTPVPVRVRARTPGEFTVEAVITSRDGQVRIGASTLTVRATAPSGVGIVLSGGAGLFLLVWWARHWRTARRARRLVAVPAE